MGKIIQVVGTRSRMHLPWGLVAFAFFDIFLSAE